MQSAVHETRQPAQGFLPVCGVFLFLMHGDRLR
ncbi:DUF1145 domain-containing protein [Pseudomonas syringae]